MSYRSCLFSSNLIFTLTRKKAWKEIRRHAGHGLNAQNPGGRVFVNAGQEEQ
jgi:hypothetical protein